MRRIPALRFGASSRAWPRWLAVYLLICVLGWNALPQQQPAIEEEAREDPTAPCLEPPPLVRWEDYRGPFQKTVGVLAQRVERKSVRQPHYKPGLILCSLGAQDKFVLSVKDGFDPVSFLNAGFNAGINQAQNRDPSFGQGSEGYAHRFGAELADQGSVRFFTEFLYPTIFSQDPRYYRLAHGSPQRRVLHALGHGFVAFNDNGKYVFNFSEWLGTTSTAVLANTYHPGNQRGFSPTATRVGYSVAVDTGFDVLREFWPEIARKLKMPFRGSGLS